MSANVTRWWWVRHAPIDAPSGTIAGRLDLPADLTDTGAVAAMAARLPFEALWLTTPLRRCRDTARALMDAKGEGLPLQVVPELTEQDFGRWQGRTHADLSAEEPEAVAAFWQAPATATPPEGESFAALVTRTAAAVEALTGRHCGRDIVMVGHAGPIRAALGHVLGLPPERMLALSVDCLHLTRLDHIAGEGPGTWRLTAANIPPR